MLSKDDLRAAKLLISARYWLLGASEFAPEYTKVLEALELASTFHNGKRNGGAPEIIHQLEIFHWLRTMHRHLVNPHIVYQLVFLHDILEDANQKTGHHMPVEKVTELFGPEVVLKAKKLSKSIGGIPNNAYDLNLIFSDIDCGVVKAADRVNNVCSMFGVFKPERMQRYIAETEAAFLPKIKEARRLFPRQEAIYENAKMVLNSQLAICKASMNGAEAS